MFSRVLVAKMAERIPGVSRAAITMRKRTITIAEILQWAEAHREITGSWPNRRTRGPTGMIGLTWSAINRALKVGGRGLPGNSSLAELLFEHKGVRNRRNRADLTEDQIVVWARFHHEKKGEWPTENGGLILGGDGETWAAVDAALRGGYRGLAGGSSLPQLLAAQCGTRNPRDLSPLTLEIILAWVDAHHVRTGEWPSYYSGPIVEAPGETWLGIHKALVDGRRGLPGRSSLARLLVEQRGVRNVLSLPDLSSEQILKWADAFHEQTGKWPNRKSGPIAESQGETWQAVDHALARGRRGLPGGSSLAKLLGLERNVPTRVLAAQLSPELILSWMDAHEHRTGKWPGQNSGPIAEAPGENWKRIDGLLRRGGRGLPGRSSLAQLLAEQRGKRNPQDLPPLSYRKIVKWAGAHLQRTGKLPTLSSGPVAEAPEERWALIDTYLREGLRGLPGGTTLHQLLIRKLGAESPSPG